LETFPYLQKLFMKEPLILTEKVVPGVVGKVDISLNVRGSGTESQTEACRLAIARALVEFTKSKQVRDAFINYDRSLLVADVRRKEACKPGISKARAKRQKSYR